MTGSGHQGQGPTLVRDATSHSDSSVLMGTGTSLHGKGRARSRRLDAGEHQDEVSYSPHSFRSASAWEESRHCAFVQGWEEGSATDCPLEGTHYVYVP